MPEWRPAKPDSRRLQAAHSQARAAALGAAIAVAIGAAIALWGAL